MTTTTRTDLSSLIDAEHDPNLTAREVAQRIVKEYRDSDPDGWFSWVNRLAVDAVEVQVRDLRRSRRSTERRMERRGTLARAVESGDFSVFDTSLVVNAQGDSKALGDCVGADLRYNATFDRKQAKTQLLEAAIKEAVARKAGTKRVRDVLSEKQYLDLRTRIGKEVA